jgi:hypothetical protein
LNIQSAALMGMKGGKNKQKAAKKAKSLKFQPSLRYLSFCLFYIHLVFFASISALLMRPDFIQAALVAIQVNRTQMTG